MPCIHWFLHSMPKIILTVKVCIHYSLDSPASPRQPSLSLVSLVCPHIFVLPRSCLCGSSWRLRRGGGRSSRFTLEIVVHIPVQVGKHGIGALAGFKPVCLRRQQNRRKQVRREAGERARGQILRTGVHLLVQIVGRGGLLLFSLGLLSLALSLALLVGSSIAYDTRGKSERSLAERNRCIDRKEPGSLRCTHSSRNRNGAAHPLWRAWACCSASSR